MEFCFGIAGFPKLPLSASLTSPSKRGTKPASLFEGGGTPQGVTEGVCRKKSRPFHSEAGGTICRAKKARLFVRLPHPPQVERYSLKRGLSGSVRRAGLVPSRSSQWPSFQVALPIQLRDSTGLAPVFPQSRRSFLFHFIRKKRADAPPPLRLQIFPHYKRMILNLQYRYPYGYIHEKSSEKS